VAHFTLWMDNCTAQNKNWTIFTAMCTFVNTESGPQSITFKYLISGHTFMSADAFHAVEKQFRVQKKLYDFDDLKGAVANASKSVTVVLLEAADFRIWKSGAYKARTSDRPFIGSLHQVRFVKGSRCMHYKLKPDDEERQYAFLTKKFKLADPPSIVGDRGIPSEKKRGIITKLCPLMPLQKKVFWKGLHASDAQDLLDYSDGDDDIDINCC